MDELCTRTKSQACPGKHQSHDMAAAAAGGVQDWIGARNENRGFYCASPVFLRFNGWTFRSYAKG